MPARSSSRSTKPRRTGTILFEVRDAGADGVFHTADDQVTTSSIDVLTTSNKAPKLDPIADKSYSLAAGQQTIGLTGISDGGNNVQSLRFSISSTDPSVAGVNTSYDDPQHATTGQLTVIPSKLGSTVVTVSVTDPGDDSVFDTLDDRSNNQKFTLNILNTINAWHNFKNPFDINDDGVVSPLDVLQVINYLNRNGSGKLPVRSESVPPFVDVDKDDRNSPIDVLLVINQLRRRAGEGEFVQSYSRNVGSNSETFDSSTPTVRVGSDEAKLSISAVETTYPIGKTIVQTDNAFVSQSPSTRLPTESAMPSVDAETLITRTNSLNNKKQLNSLYEDQVDLAISELYSSAT